MRAGGWGWGNGAVGGGAECFPGTEFQLGKMTKFWRWVVVARGSVAEGGSSTCKGPEVGALGSPVEDGGEAGSSGPPKAGLDPHFASGCGSLGANLRGRLTSLSSPPPRGGLGQEAGEKGWGGWSSVVFASVGGGGWGGGGGGGVGGGGGGGGLLRTHCVPGMDPSLLSTYYAPG